MKKLIFFFAAPLVLNFTTQNTSTITSLSSLSFVPNLFNAYATIKVKLITHMDAIPFISLSIAVFFLICFAINLLMMLYSGLLKRDDE